MIVSNNVKSHIKNLVGNKDAPNYNKTPKNKQYLGQPVNGQGGYYENGDPDGRHGDRDGPYDPEMKNQSRPKSANDNRRPTEYY